MSATQLSYEEWEKLGESLFGKDKKNWKFKCPCCKNVQSYYDFEGLGMDKEKIERYLHFSCIGRFTKGKGCDWTLGGLFQIHKVEVKKGDRVVPVFEFFGLEK